MNRKIIIVGAIIAVLTAVLIAVAVITQRIPMSDSDTGNLAGNLHNNGLFFEMDGKVYFANPYDGNCMYSMNADESKPKRLTTLGVKYISGANGYLYYYMDSSVKSTTVKSPGNVVNQYGLYRCKANGKKQTAMLRDMVGEVQLCGEYLYYQVKTDGGRLEKMKVDKTDKQLVANEMISPVCYDNGVIYYTGVSEDHNIHAMYTRNGDMVTGVLTGSCFFPVVQYGYIYYLDGTADYTLWRASLATGIKEQVTTGRVDCFTMDAYNIYYALSDASNPALVRCSLDGSNQIILYNGIVNSLNLTSRYLYFKTYGNDDILYHIPLDGNAPASVFTVEG